MQDDTPQRTSVTGTIYTPTDNTNTNTNTTSETKKPIIVQLFTKKGCTLCDKVKDILYSIHTSSYPHTLQAIDITDPDQSYYYDKYKYDIPVLHIHHQYWTKHRLTVEEALQGFQEIVQDVEKGGWMFDPPKVGEPDAGAMERRQMERRKKQEQEMKKEKAKDEDEGDWWS